MRRVLGLLLAIALAFPGAVAAQPPPCRDHLPCPPPGPVAMGRLLTAGAETRDITAEGVTVLSGSPTISTTNPRTGAASFRSGPTTLAAAHQFAITGALNVTYYFRGYFYVSTLVGGTVTIVRFLNAGAQASNVTLNADGTISNSGGPDVSIVFPYGQWVLVEASWIQNGTDQRIALRVDGVQVSTNKLVAIQTNNLTGIAWGFVTGTSGVSDTADVDDVAINDSQGASQNTWAGPGSVALLTPTADSAVGTGWTLGTGTAISANSGSTAVKNTPPVGVADLAAGSDPKQIRNATANANSNYDATMTTYSAAGIGPNDVVNVIDPIVSTAAPVTTSSKQGTVGVASNPAIANIALGATGTSGAFWQGNTAGTYPTGWKTSHGTTTYAPSVTLGTAPVMRITQVTSSTRIAMVCFMGIYVDYTPGPLPYVNVYPPMIGQ